VKGHSWCRLDQRMASVMSCVRRGGGPDGEVLAAAMILGPDLVRMVEYARSGHPG
jgi:hypothetical protein